MKAERPIKELHYDEDQGGNKIFDSFWYIESLENYANELESNLKEVEQENEGLKIQMRLQIEAINQLQYIIDQNGIEIVDDMTITKTNKMKADRTEEQYRRETKGKPVLSSNIEGQFDDDYVLWLQSQLKEERKKPNILKGELLRHRERHHNIDYRTAINWCIDLIRKTQNKEDES